MRSLVVLYQSKEGFQKKILLEPVSIEFLLIA